jgi:hypothetical protein
MDDIEAIKEQVPLSAVLYDYGVQFLDSGEPEQIHCPFHHPDTNRSARFYPENQSIYCFVCDRTWDVIAFVQGKEQLTFAEACRYIKSKYHVEIHVPDYVARLFAVRKPAPEQIEDFSETVERVFIKFTETLTRGNIYSILDTYNKCLAAKDDLVQSGNFSQKELKEWYESSVARLQSECTNGQTINQALGGLDGDTADC